MGKESEREVKKDRKIVLRQKRTKKKKEKSVEVRKTEKRELLRKLIVKIGLERIDT